MVINLVSIATSVKIDNTKVKNPGFICFYSVYLFQIIMSFFNLTQLGADNAVKSSVAVHSVPCSTAPSCGRQSAHSSVSSRFGETVLPNSEANGSHEKYTTMLQKHQRSPNGKNYIVYAFYIPVT